MSIDEYNLTPGWRRRVIDWATETSAVREVWIFGSRGPKGGARPDSDLDIGIMLEPAMSDHDWVLGDYMALGDRWQSHLADLVGRHVSLEGMRAGSAGDEEIRRTGVRLWSRPSS